MRWQDNDSDDVLIIAAEKGSESAAAQLYARYADKVYRIAYRITLDENLAKDCAQETWIKAFAKIHRYRLGSSFPAWLAAIAVHSAIDLLRQCRKRRSVECENGEEEYGQPVEPAARLRLEECEIHAAVDLALEQLPANQRAAFVMRHYEELPLKTIAETLGCLEGTVKTHIHRAVKAVRSVLRKKLDGRMEKP
ncbi:MAG: sigma-70 family RNA polymerase sigma factor [Candidatus Omnitrophota bacterium]